MKYSTKSVLQILPLLTMHLNDIFVLNYYSFLTVHQKFSVFSIDILMINFWDIDYIFGYCYSSLYRYIKCVYYISLSYANTENRGSRKPEVAIHLYDITLGKVILYNAE